jgi:hypothetical protein
MEQETSTLILNTFDIDPNVTAVYYNTTYPTIDNQYGNISNNRCNLTWKNINMRMVLGVMYDKYETFNMYLYQVNQSQGFGAAPVAAQYQLVDIKMKGLQFLNNNYNVVSRNNTNTAFLTSYILNNGSITSAGTVTPMFNPTIVTFGKGTECVDINIDMKCTLDQKYPTILTTDTNRAFGTFIFLFKFYGIPNREQNDIVNGSRMNINIHSSR